MRLVSIDYSEHKGEPLEWAVSGLKFTDINLIVGKNAVGKSRVLHVINNLSILLSAGTRLTISEGHYIVHFDHDGKDIVYELEIHGKKVVHEEFRRDEMPLLSRGQGGIGTIYAERANQHLEFQTPEDELAVVVRRDRLQHPYLEPLYQWASKVLVYHFGTALGRESFLGFAPPVQGLPPTNFRDETQVISTYMYGFSKFQDEFDKIIREDMQFIGYEVEDIVSDRLQTIQFNPTPGQPPVPIIPFGLTVKEKDLPARIEQLGISSGMFRALSIFIQLNRAFMEGGSNLIVIDDIGEGLDYDRSCQVIKRLMWKTKQAGVQLIMSTNDRYVMNAVPIENWMVLHRKRGGVRVFDYENSREAFDDFNFTGLNNFDFFAYDYLSDAEAESQNA